MDAHTADGPRRRRYRAHFSVVASVLADSPYAAHMVMQDRLWELFEEDPNGPILTRDVIKRSVQPERGA
jgi:hypothetical protein